MPVAPRRPVRGPPVSSPARSRGIRCLGPCRPRPKARHAAVRGWSPHRPPRDWSLGKAWFWNGSRTRGPQITSLLLYPLSYPNRLELNQVRRERTVSNLGTRSRHAGRALRDSRTRAARRVRASTERRQVKRKLCSAACELTHPYFPMPQSGAASSPSSKRRRQRKTRLLPRTSRRLAGIGSLPAQKVGA